MSQNICNICVTGWFFIKIDEKKWKDKPSIHGKLLFWIYFVKFAQKNFLLNSNASSQSSEVGVSKWKKNRQFLRRFAMFNVTVVCGHRSSKNDHKNDSHSLFIFICILKKKTGCLFHHFEQKYRDSWQRRNIGVFVFSIILIVTSV